MNPNLIILLFTIGVAILAFINSQSDEETKNKIKCNTEKLKESTESLQNTTQQLKKTGDTTISNLEKVNDKIVENYQLNKETAEDVREVYRQTLENLKKTIQAKEEIIDQQNNFIGNLTGGDSYCYMVIVNKKFMLIHKGDYRLSQVNIKIDFSKGDFNNVNSLQGLHIDAIYQDNVIDNLDIPQAILSDIRNNSFSGFDIVYTTPYKKWVQITRFFNSSAISSNIEHYTYVYELNNSRINSQEQIKRLYVQASEDYKTFNILHKLAFNKNEVNLLFYPHPHPKQWSVDINLRDLKEQVGAYLPSEFE